MPKAKTAREKNIDLLIGEKNRLNQKFGHGTGSLASDPYQLKVISSGIFSVDYALGTGGWPRGHYAEVYGIPDIGKSSIFGINLLKSTQKQGLLPGIIAFEPYIDDEWLADHGVDPDLVVIARPDTAEDGVEVLWDWINGGILDAVLFDSLASMPLDTEVKDDGKKQAYGNSSMIAFAIRRTLMRAYKNNVFGMFINQVRDKAAGNYVTLDAPGGWAKAHGCSIRVKLRPGRNKYTQKIDGHDVLVGREILAEVVRNKLNEGTGHVAHFDFYQKHTDEYPFGVDTAKDIINTGKMTGVIDETSAGNFVHHTFPQNKKGNNKIIGIKNVEKFFSEHPEATETIHQEVLAVMVEKVEEREQKAAEKEERKLKVVGDE